MSIQQIEALKRYARAIRETLRAGPTNIEQALAPSFKNLIDDLLPTLLVGQGLTTVPEYANDAGRPDIALVRQGQLPRAFIELKAPDKHLDPTRWRDAHDKRQLRGLANCPYGRFPISVEHGSFVGERVNLKFALSRRRRSILRRRTARRMPQSTGTMPGHSLKS